MRWSLFLGYVSVGVLIGVLDVFREHKAQLNEPMRPNDENMLG